MAKGEGWRRFWGEFKDLLFLVSIVFLCGCILWVQ